MTKEEIIELARQAGLDPDLWNYTDAFETFARLVAAKERKACAKVCDDRAFRFLSESPFFAEMHGLADAIRARGQE